MLIPSIDLQGGKIVQLVQGEKKALEFDDFNYWIARFSSYPLVQLIDLDAAMGTGSNHELVASICNQLPCQVGGGIQSIKQAQTVLAQGAKRIILGSALLSQGKIDVAFASEVADSVGAEHLTFAVDSRGGSVVIKGWKEKTSIDPLEMVSALEPYCAAFLYTHVDTEGTLSGFPIEAALRLRTATSRQLIVAGGIRSMDEVHALDAIRVDAVVGMAIYTGKIS